MEMKQSMRRGFTLIEVITAATVGMLATIILAESSLIAAKTFKKVTDVSKTHTFGRRAFDRFVADIQQSDMSLGKFPTWSANPWFTAKDNECIILRQRVFDSKNVVQDLNYNVIVYKLVPATTPEDGPFVLQRINCTTCGEPWLAEWLNEEPGLADLFKSWGITLIGADSQGQPTVVAKNIKSVKWNQMTSQTFWGDRSNTKYTLTSTPIADTNEIKLQALVGGVNRLASGHATQSGRVVTLFKAMEYGVALDVTYHIDPTVEAFYEGSNGATSIFTKFVFEPRWMGNDMSTKTREITLSAMPNLENRMN